MSIANPATLATLFCTTAKHFFFGNKSFELWLNRISKPKTLTLSWTCRYDSERQALILARPSGRESALHPAFVRRNDTSAASINEWTGEKVAAGGAVSDGIAPIAIQAVGNYAVLIMWEDGFNQVQHPLPFLK